MIEMNNYTVIGNAIYQAIKKNHEKIYYSDIIKFSELVANKLKGDTDIYFYAVGSREIDDFTDDVPPFGIPSMIRVCGLDGHYIISRNYKFGASILDDKDNELVKYERYYRFGNPKIFVEICDEVGNLVWDEKPSLKDTRVEEMVQSICLDYVPGCIDCPSKGICRIREHCSDLYDVGYRKPTHIQK